MSLEIRDQNVPAFLYGTAWKEERTEELVALALDSGFSGIDTANQRKHYHEVGVGAAIARSGRARGSLFLQTKFTYQRGQDHRLPYDPDAAAADQVRQSFRSSLEHLQTDYVDSYVLHGPASANGWTDTDREVWTTMESLHQGGHTRRLGVSNISAEQLKLVLQDCDVAPAFVQNRCFARTRWDSEVRAICRDHDVVYQGFSLLTANRSELASRQVQEIAQRHDATVAQVVFRFSMALGMLPLTGTTDVAHMREDLEAATVELTESDIQTLETISTLI